MSYLRQFLLIVPLLTGGCVSAFDETHYLRSNATNADGSAMNYYKVQVNGQTFLSSSRYQSGYFDEQALDVYFNEFTQPASGPATKPSYDSGCAKSTSDPDGGVSSLDHNQKGKLLLLLSSNSDAIATGIGALAQSTDISSQLAQLLGGKTGGASQQKADKQKAIGAFLASQGENTFSALPTSATADQATQASLDYVNQLAAYLGNTTPFKTLNEAHEWFLQNSPSIISK